MKKAVLYDKLDSKKVKCKACSHRCIISEGETGICGVRKNLKGDLYLSVYGKIISKNSEPIEKKPFYHFLPGSKTFSIGTVGCNFKCDFCQNAEISQFREFYKNFSKNNFPGEKITPKEIVKEALENNCKSISYTYNEPTIFSEFIRDISILAKKNGLKNLLVTNGFMTKECLDFLSKDNCIDAMNIDLKSFNDEFYKKICKARLNPVLETIKRAFKKGIFIEITTLIIPSLNDSEKELNKIAKFIYSIDNKGNIPWHISRFFPFYKMVNSNITPLSSLTKAKKIGEKYLKYVYIGNI